MVRLLIDNVTPQAEGVGRLAGRVVFVPGALAGETVELELVQSKKSYARGRLIRVLDPSPERIHPDCPHFGPCGGCQLQHLEPAAQDRFKQETFRSGLSRALKQEHPPLLPLIPATSRFHYRHRLRLKWGAGEHGGVLGFYQHRTHRITPVRACLLALPIINIVLDFLGPRIGRLPTPNRPLDLEIQLLSADGPALVLIRPSEALTRARREGLSRMIMEHPEIKAVFFQEAHTGPLTGSIPFCPESHSFRYKISSRVNLPGRELILACFPSVFSQVNTRQNQRLLSLLMERCTIHPGDLVWDLYCGQGNFTLPLGLISGECLGVESSEAAINNALWNQKVNNIEACRFLRAQTLEGLHRFSRAHRRPDWVVLDPPRSGAREIISVLADKPHQGIFYISCDPLTLFRDLVALSSRGWKLVWTQPIDFFPQTYHLESLSFLRK